LLQLAVLVKKKKIYIKTFGCIQNEADSERIRTFYGSRGYFEVLDWKKADLVIVNSCIVRQSAENRTYGLINNIDKYKNKTGKKIKIVLTGCLVGLGDKNLRKKLPQVEEFIPINRVNCKVKPKRNAGGVALIPISSGCDNFCSYCIVPYARGREQSRSKKQNVNSYGRGRFPGLLEKVAKKKLKKVSFVSSNPWDFSDELIRVVAEYKNVDRLIHLPLQSGDDEILDKMNRPYTAKKYLRLIKKIRKKVPKVRFSTDILIGFPGENRRAFGNTLKVCQKVGFELAYINKYSPRTGTVSAKLYKDNVPMKEKKRRWRVLDEMINKKLS